MEETPKNGLRQLPILRCFAFHAIEKHISVQNNHFKPACDGILDSIAKIEFWLPRRRHDLPIKIIGDFFSLLGFAFEQVEDHRVISVGGFAIGEMKHSIREDKLSGQKSGQTVCTML
ncbi:hypothetical protein [Cohaesibacter marisflavi]|uniref:hypothetical protein n=1 Tax=Cohaesibacter marisflavi TaxID=655353 RepID=UPI001FCCFF8D|nr:hypothetical protein [Cohaesibacter marisflavi]